MNHDTIETFKLERQEDGRLVLSGVLDHSNVTSAREQGENLLAEAGPSCTISLVGLKSAHSAVFSLLLCWLRYAAKRQQSLMFADMPERLYDMARVSGLDDLLPLLRQESHQD